MTTRDRVVVTGGAGFIGSALCERLARAGERVVAIDNLANGKRENLAHLPAQSVNLIVADVRAPETFAAELRAARAVFHLACLGLRHSLHSAVENHDVNGGGTLRLLEAARAAGVPRFVQVSSSEVYGPALATPMNEDHPTKPTTVYGAAKLAGEAYARAFHASAGLAVTIVRPFNAYGPRCHHEGDAGEVIPKFVLRALAGQPLTVFGDGQQTRDFTYVDDTAEGIAAAARGDGAIGETINLGNGTAMRVLDLAREVERATGELVHIVHDTPRPGDVRALCADASRAARILGFHPKVAFADGLARLVAWYRSRGIAPAALLAEEVERNWLVPARRDGTARHVG